MKQLVLLMCILSLLACSDSEDPKSRTYRMGFQNSAPRIDDINLFLQSLDIWTLRADAAIITTEVPWKELFGGMSVNDYVLNNYKLLVDYYRDKNLKLWIYIDPQNGLDRTSDALDLIAAGKSISDPDVQLLYRKFVITMDSILNPEHLGLALETNLIRDAASASNYKGVKDAANAAAQDILSRSSNVKLSVSVQVDHAWGKLIGGTYKGIDQDLIDFPFVEELGLSSYPYFGFDQPKDIPVNYYSRLVEGKNYPVFISEGGWASAPVTTPDRTFASSPELQRGYIQHQAELLDQVQAIALFQLTFTDIDVASLPSDVPASIAYFSSLGLVDINLDPKPALSAWDDLFTKRALK